MKAPPHRIRRSYYKPVYAQGHEIGDPVWWRVFRWAYLVALLLHPFYIPSVLWPYIWVLLGTQLVAVLKLNELPFLSLDWLVRKIRSGDRGNEYEPGWYGYKGRTVRGRVDQDGMLWFPFVDLELPEPAPRLMQARYGPGEIQRHDGIAYVSLDGLQRGLAEFPTTEARALQRWLESTVIPSHRRLFEAD